MATPTEFEQEALELINRARTDPYGEYDLLILDAATRTGVSQDITDALRYFNVDMELLTEQLQSAKSVAPIAWNTDLAAMARQHSAELIAADLQSHQVPGEPDLGQRAKNVGYPYSLVSENVFAYTEDPTHGHAGFFIDWGTGPGGIQDPAGHRVNILNGEVTEVGIGVLTDSDPGTRVGPFVQTQNFGARSSYQSQLLGVVFDDGDGDAFYDAGEGLGAVTITAVSATGTTFTTQTWDAGGYQMVLPAGTYTVTYSGGELAGDGIVSYITMGTQNLKLDVEADQAPGGSDGPDRMVGTAGPDRLDGRGGNDTIQGFAGNDLLLGGDGADSLDAGAGRDTVHGGNGPDFVVLGAGDDIFHDTVQGGELGRDTVFGNDGQDTIQGGNGDDEFHGGEGHDLIYGRFGNDLLFGGDGFDTIHAGAGDDTVHGGDGRDLVDLGAGDDIFFDTPQGGAFGQDTVFGQDGDDTINGGNGDDEFHGGDGHDLIHGRLGNDFIHGGTGFDTIFSGDGDDVVHGGDGRDLVAMGLGDDIFFDTGQGGGYGRDTVYANQGHDTINGGGGDDEFHGGHGHDVIRGGLGNDLIFGGTGFDTIEAGDGADTVYAGDGRDVVRLGAGNDVFFDTGQGGGMGSDLVFGDAGRDSLEAGNGNDTLDGGSGDDRLVGRLGDDVLIGGTGRDSFVFTDGFGADVVTDFELGIDSLIFAATYWDGISGDRDFLGTYGKTVGDAVLLAFDDGSSVRLDGLASAFDLVGDIHIL